MDQISVFTIIQSALGGLAIFLLGMHLMSEGLQALAGAKLNRIISAVTDNRFFAVLVGIGVTCVIQSSSATTVMVVGFVNSGLMTLLQGIGVVFGANIGTTLSLWLLTLDLSKYGELMIGLSVFVYLFVKKEKIRNIGMAVLGLGMLFFGLKLMSQGFYPLRTMSEVRDALGFFRASDTLGWIAAVSVGAVVTGIVQSSAAVIVIVMGLSGANVVDFPTAIALVLGSNIGTTATAMLACIGANRNALRVAIAHTFFNLIGVIGVTLVWRYFVSGCSWFIERTWMGSPEHDIKWYTYAISCVHTFFNVTATLILFPFMRTFASTVTKLIPMHSSEQKRTGYKPRYLDKHIIGQGAIALGQSQKEILLMGETCISMLGTLRKIFTAPEIDENLAEGIFHEEVNMDVAQKDISEYIGFVIRDASAGSFLSDNARRQLRQADEFESFSDYIRNALKSYMKIRNAGETLTEPAMKEVTGLIDMIEAYAHEVIDIVTIGDKFNVAKAREESATIDKAAKTARDAHMKRIGVTCLDPVKSLVYSDLLVAFRRQNDHLLNIAQTLEA